MVGKAHGYVVIYEPRFHGTFSVEGVRLDTCKPAKDAIGYILRLFNYHDAPATARICVSALALDAEIPFAGQEFKTIRICEAGWREVDLLTEQ